MGLQLLVLQQDWLRLLDSQGKIEIIRDRVGNRKKKVFLYRTHSAYFYIILILPPQKSILYRLINSSRKGKKAGNFESGETDVSEKG